MFNQILSDHKAKRAIEFFNTRRNYYIVFNNFVVRLILKI